jgi:hypothetical protein
MSKRKSQELVTIFTICDISALFELLYSFVMYYDEMIMFDAFVQKHNLHTFCIARQIFPKISYKLLPYVIPTIRSQEQLEKMGFGHNLNALHTNDYMVKPLNLSRFWKNLKTINICCISKSKYCSDSYHHIASIQDWNCPFLENLRCCRITSSGIESLAYHCPVLISLTCKLHGQIFYIQHFTRLEIISISNADNAYTEPDVFIGHMENLQEIDMNQHFGNINIRNVPKLVTTMTRHGIDFQQLLMTGEFPSLVTLDLGYALMSRCKITNPSVLEQILTFKGTLDTESNIIVPRLKNISKLTLVEQWSCEDLEFKSYTKLEHLIWSEIHGLEVFTMLHMNLPYLRSLSLSWVGGIVLRKIIDLQPLERCAQLEILKLEVREQNTLIHLDVIWLLKKLVELCVTEISNPEHLMMINQWKEVHSKT